MGGCGGVVGGGGGGGGLDRARDTGGHRVSGFRVSRTLFVLIGFSGLDWKLNLQPYRQ